MNSSNNDINRSNSKSYLETVKKEKKKKGTTKESNNDGIENKTKIQSNMGTILSNNNNNNLTTNKQNSMNNVRKNEFDKIMK